MSSRRSLNQQQKKKQHYASHAAAGSTNYHISNMALMSDSQPQQPYAQNYPQRHLDVREAWVCFQQHCADQHQSQLQHLKLHQQQQIRAPHQDEGAQQKQGQDEASILQNWQKQNIPQQQQKAVELQQQLEQLVQQKLVLETMQQQKVQMEEERKMEQVVKHKRALEMVQQKAQQMEDGWKFQKQQQSFLETFNAAQLLCATKVGNVSATTENLMVASTSPNLCMPMHASPKLPTNVGLSPPRVPELPRVETPTIHASPELPTNVGLSSPPRASKLPTEDVRLSPPPSPCAPGDVGWAWSLWTGSDETDLLSCDEAKDTEDGQQEMKWGEARSLWKPNSIHVSVDDSSSSTVGYLSYPEIPRKDEIPLRSMALALPPSLHQSVINRQQMLKELSQSAITTKGRVLKAHTSDLTEGILFSSASKTNIGRSTRTLSNTKSATSKHVASNQRLFTSKIQHQQGEQLSSSTTLTAKMKFSQKDRELKAVSVPKRSRSPMIAQPVAVSKKKLLPLSSDRVEEARTVSESPRSRLDRINILSFSDDSTGYAAAETCQSNKKRSRSAEDGGANDIPHDIDIDGTYHDDEFVDDLPNCISWNHNKKHYIDRDGLAILAAKVKDKYEAISIDRPPPKECGRQNCWFDLHRAAGPTQVAEKGEGKLKSTDSALSQSSSPAPTTTQSDSLTKKKKQKMSTDDQSFTKKTKKVMSNLFSSSNPSSPFPKSFTLPAPKSQSGCEARLFKDGKRVFAPWFGKAGSSLRVYYYPAVVMSHKLVQKGEELGAVVFYDVRFDDDGVFKDDIQGSLVISTKKYLKRNLKPMLSVGDEVYAAWWEDSRTRTSAPSWFPGVIKACEDLGYGGRHGLIRIYDITYDDGDELKSIEDYLVMKKDDYLITNSKVTEDGNVDPTWLGVRNKVDETSIDRWANEIGWYVATINGQDQSFSYLTDALRAYDAFVVSCKGNQTKKTDLNIPQEWEFPTPLGICAPVHVFGEHISAEDLCDVEDNLTIRRRDSDLDIDSQGKFDRRRVSKSKSKLVNSPNQEGSNKETASSSIAMAINLMTEPCSDKSRHGHKVIEIERNETQQKSISDSSSRLTSSDESHHRVVTTLDTDTSDEPNDPTTRTGYIKPIIKKGEKVYACWSGPNGDGKVFFPGRVWDVRDNGVSSEYGPVMMYDIVYDDGDTESNVHEIWVIKKEEWEMYHRKPEESWIGVTNVTFPTSEDHYANTLGWYKLSSSTYVDVKNPPIYSSLGDALRAHDRQVIETKGQDNVTAKELNFPEEHGLVI